MICSKFQVLSSKKNGFTLIEMMVSALIFSIIIGATIGVFVSALRMQRYNLTYQQLLDQTSYAIEYMSRAIRMAKKNEGGVPCFDMGDENYFEGPGDLIEFATYHDPGQCWKFFLDNKQLKIDKDGVPYDLTSDNFEVENFKVEVSGDESGDTSQPRVTVFMEIKGGGSGPQPRIRIQTTISQRDLDKEL